ncbi:MAG: hypothetical protein A2Y91_01000 [Chloroflexi bacterium RBG_13_54_8]|nr:MAG: hypothetical protein A2Y91_01000 [Chloroflexi bacterium RBG_13_54_8]
MGFLFLIILFALAILVLAFVGVFGRFPDNWEWVSIVLAGWGLAMGVPSVFQMVFGHPKLLRNYDRHVRNQERALMIFLKNPPLDKKSIWRKLGVRRDTVASLSASFRISEVAKVTIPIMHARIYSDDDPTEAGSWRIALPPTFSWSTSIMVAWWDDTKKKAIVLGDKVRDSTELPAGVYRIEIVFLIEGQSINEAREFIVGDKADDLIWVKPR